MPVRLTPRWGKKGYILVGLAAAVIALTLPLTNPWWQMREDTARLLADSPFAKR